EDPIEPHADATLMEDRAKPLAKDKLKSPAFEERDFATRAGGSGGAMAGDLSAIFKDTNLSSQRPDFQSFLKKGDDRLKLREQAEASRSGKNLKGGRESNRGGLGRDRRGGDGGGPEDQDFGEGEGLLPGKGRSGAPKGEATGRLRASPYDVGVEGESRRGKKEGYDTNLTGRAGQMPSRLMYLGVVGQYRKMMEDAITREQVPRDYHDQIRNYFQALDER